MQSSTFIAVKDNHKYYGDFVRFMDATTDALKLDSKQRSSYYLSRNGEKLEEDVLNVMRAKAQDYRFEPSCIIKTEKQHFPDIVANSYYGVEVKSTKNNSWRSTGSSIVETLRQEEVQRVFMLFGILSPDNIDFRCRPYEQCLTEIAVTHSPRYLIDMDMSNGEQTIFEKLGVPYDTFRTMGDEQIHVIRKYYKQKYRNQSKSLPWWIGDDTDHIGLPEQLRHSDEIRFLSDVWSDEQTKSYIYKCLYVLFPEILGNDNRTKYKKATLWLCSRLSLLCGSVRDIFSAGGQGRIFINGTLELECVPKVLCVFLMYMQSIKAALVSDNTLLEEIMMYSDYYTEGQDIYKLWKANADRYIQETLGRSALSIDRLMEYSYIKCEDRDYYLVSR